MVSELALREAMGLIRRHEGLRLRAYMCAAGVWTVGYGHTGPDVRRGVTVDEAEAERLLEADARAALLTVTAAVAGRRELTDRQLAALASFVYNVGGAAFRRSTMLRLIKGGAEHGRVAAEFGRWVYGGGKVLPGLVIRRAEEAAMYRGW